MLFSNFYSQFTLFPENNFVRRLRNTLTNMFPFFWKFWKPKMIFWKRKQTACKWFNASFVDWLKSQTVLVASGWDWLDPFCLIQVSSGRPATDPGRTQCFIFEHASVHNLVRLHFLARSLLPSSLLSTYSKFHFPLPHFGFIVLTDSELDQFCSINSFLNL